MRLFRPWLMVTILMALVFAVAAFWGLIEYQAKQERELHAPQRLLDSLQDVSSGAKTLDMGVIDPELLRANLIARIQAELIEDLSAAGHPKPEEAADLLLGSASRFLYGREGLLLTLQQVLEDLAEYSWNVLIQQPEQWLVQAGNECLLLSYAEHGERHDVLWLWVALSACPQTETL